MELLMIKITLLSIVVTLGLVACYGPKQQYEPPAPNAKGVYPNPFSPIRNLEIPYELSDSCEISIVIYDAKGVMRDTVLHDLKGPGAYQVLWEPDTSFTSGVYFYLLQCSEVRSTGKFVLLY